jgi:hypothetical protein
MTKSHWWFEPLRFSALRDEQRERVRLFLSLSSAENEKD